jgi:hypothetical protein
VGSENAFRRVLGELAGDRRSVRLGGRWPGVASIDHLGQARSGVGPAVQAERECLAIAMSSVRAVRPVQSSRSDQSITLIEAGANSATE